MDPIRKRLESLTTETEWNGEKIRFRQLGAFDGVEILKAIQGLEFGEDEEAKDVEQGRRFYILLISKTYVDEHGNKIYDSEEGREQLGHLPLPDVMSLGKLANLHCGIGDEAKKN